MEIPICWILGSVIGSMPFFWHQDLPLTRCFYHDVITEGYQMFRFVFVILIPACIILSIYVMIYKVILHQVCAISYFGIIFVIFRFSQLNHEDFVRRASCCHENQNQSESQTCVHEATKREIKVTFNILIIMLFFMICWLPLNVIKALKILCKSCTVSDSVITFCIVLTHFNSALNPLLYACHLRDFRRAFLKLFGCCKREASMNC